MNSAIHNVLNLSEQWIPLFTITNSFSFVRIKFKNKYTNELSF